MFGFQIVGGFSQLGWDFLEQLLSFTGQWFHLFLKLSNIWTHFSLVFFHVVFHFVLEFSISSYAIHVQECTMQFFKCFAEWVCGSDQWGCSSCWITSNAAECELYEEKYNKENQSIKRPNQTSFQYFAWIPFQHQINLSLMLVTCARQTATNANKIFAIFLVVEKNCLWVISKRDYRMLAIVSLFIGNFAIIDQWIQDRLNWRVW